MSDLLQLCSFFYVAASVVCSVIAVSMVGLWSVTVECPCHTYMFFAWHCAPPGQIHLYLGLVARKPVFGVSDKARFKPVSSDTETG